MNKYLEFHDREYIKSNLLFAFFVISSLINAILIRVLTVHNLLNIKPIFVDMAFLLFIASFSFFMLPKRKIFYFMTLSIVFSAILFIDAIYYSYYNSFASASLLLTSLQLADLQDATIKNIMTPKHFILLWQPIVMWYSYKFLYQYPHIQGSTNQPQEKHCFSKVILISLTALAIFACFSTPTDYSRLRSQWYREYIVMQFGIFTYHINDTVKSVTPEIYAMTGYDAAYQRFTEFYDEKNIESQNIENQYKKIFKGRDVFVIHAESMQKFLMELSFNGEEVTPNLNRLAGEGMFFSNFYSQPSIGTSSDAEFTFNTSLMPANNGTVFINYFNKKYVSLPELLKDKGYYAFSMHANDASFWNRAVMHRNMGYDEVIDKSRYNIDEYVGLGLSDSSFFKQSVPKIKEIKEREQKPIYATLIMLTNHTPFDQATLLPPFSVDYKKGEGDQTESIPYMEGTKMGNYIKCANYADMAIGQLIDDLDAEGLLDNAVVVIYGDHDAKLPAEQFEMLNNFDPDTGEFLDKSDPNFIEEDFYKYEMDRKVPFIIWTKDKKYHLEVSETMGMLDAMPTLGNMLGIKSRYQMGHDIFDVSDNIVAFPNGNFITDEMYYDSQKVQYKLLEDKPVSAAYIEDGIKHVNDLIKISNDIMRFDLIKADLNKEQ